MTQVYNFSAGPAMLPVEVLRRAEQELRNWHGLGTSVRATVVRNLFRLKKQKDSC